MGRILLGNAPSEYNKVFLYATKRIEIEKRFPLVKGTANLFVLKTDEKLPSFGKVTPVSQTFVDLWNLPDWFAADFLDALKEKFYAGLLQ